MQRAIEAEFSQRKARVEAAEKSAATQAQLCEEANRQAAEAERRTSVLKSEAERSNEHAAVRLGHCSACLVDSFDLMFGCVHNLADVLGRLEESWCRRLVMKRFR